MQGEMYRCVKMQIGDKKRDITVYSPQALHRQRVLLQKTRNVLKKRIHKSAYGYVEGRSTWTAAQYLLKHTGRHARVLVCDIKAFFPSIDRNILTIMLHQLLDPGDVEEMMLFASCCESGIAQGSPLSPALSNCYLHDMDRALCMQPRTTYLRYADDLIILSDDTDQALHVLREQLRPLRLRVNEKKIYEGITKAKFHFLGFEFYGRRLRVSREKQQEMNIRMNLANDAERRTIFQGFQAYYRNTSYLHPDLDTLRWVLRYAPMMQSATYIRQFSSAQWKQAQKVLRDMDHSMKTWTSAAVVAPVGRVFYKESIRSAG